MDRANLFALDPEPAARVNARLETVERQRDAVEHLAALLLRHRTLEGAALERILAAISDRIVD